MLANLAFILLKITALPIDYKHIARSNKCKE